MKTLKQIIKSHWDIIPYLFFGVCTTLINVIIYWGASHILGFFVMMSTVLAWILAVLFAYITNRKWVFHSKAKESLSIIKELISFIACRLATGVVDIVCMYLFVEIMHFEDVIIKFGANLLVIILNYLASKLIIFRKRR